MKQISKFLSLLLRHQPELLDLKMDNEGWVSIDELVAKLTLDNPTISHETISNIVASDNKGRFEVKDGQIRACQGHSIEVDVTFKEVEITSENGLKMYHGTATSNVKAIMEEGLKKMNRRNVHMCQDIETAEIVAKRWNKPYTILEITIPKGHKGIELSSNGYYLAESVDSNYIKIL